jgi:alpha-tubulin suppressor-like RCC1 family protein
MPTMPTTVPARTRSHLAAAAVALLGAVACTDPASPEREPARANALLTPVYGGPTLYMAAVPQIVGGEAHSCALRKDYVVLCWGKNDHGQLGMGGEYGEHQLSSNTPVQVVGGILFKQIAAGYKHTCGIDRDGKAYCWGGPAYGEIGDGGGSPRPSPSAVAGGHTFKAITGGRRHTCGITTAGTAYCWGWEEYGQIGNGIAHYWSAWTPESVHVDQKFKAISAGADHTCALTTTGVAMCWGRGGTLGNGTSTLSSVPVYVGGGLLFSTLDAGAFHTCGTTSGGAGYCWGWNGDGALGAQTFNSNMAWPVRVGTASDLFRYIDAGGHHSCGIRKYADGTLADTTENVACWGSAASGQLGFGGTVGGTTLRTVATDSAGGVGFRAIGLGMDHSCGITRLGRAYCWGNGASGQVGTVAALSVNLVPRAVAGNHDFSW